MYMYGWRRVCFNVKLDIWFIFFFIVIYYGVIFVCDVSRDVSKSNFNFVKKNYKWKGFIMKINLIFLFFIVFLWIVNCF